MVVPKERKLMPTPRASLMCHADQHSLCTTEERFSIKTSCSCICHAEAPREEGAKLLSRVAYELWHAVTELSPPRPALVEASERLVAKYALAVEPTTLLAVVVGMAAEGYWSQNDLFKALAPEAAYHG
jgi:hypothetical protein